MPNSNEGWETPAHIKKQETQKDPTFPPDMRSGKSEGKGKGGFGGSAETANGVRWGEMSHLCNSSLSSSSFFKFFSFSGLGFLITGGSPDVDDVSCKMKEARTCQRPGLLVGGTTKEGKK